MFELRLFFNCKHVGSHYSENVQFLQILLDNFRRSDFHGYIVKKA